jgi:hypothetical protein
MALPSSPNQISIQDILNEKQGSTTLRTHVSLKGLSVNGTDDYTGVDITGTPNGTEPYNMSEFHAWSAVYADFTVRGNETGNPSRGIFSQAESTETGAGDQADAEAMARFHIYYNLSGNIGIHAIPVANARFAIDEDDRYYEPDGTQVILGTGASDFPPNPSIEIIGIDSGYKCAVEIDQNGSITGGTSNAEIRVTKAGFNTLTYNSGTDLWTHTGTATIPVQTSSSFTPQTLRVDIECFADAYGGYPISQQSSYVSADPIFKFTFTKASSPTYYVYVKADLTAQAQVIF